MTMEQPTQDDSQTFDVQSTGETDEIRVEDGDMSANYTHITAELDQIGTGSDENLEIEQKSLNGAFAEYLIKTPQGDTNALSVLRDRVQVVKESGSLRSRAGKEAVDALATFLDDIGNPERMGKDYEEFMKKIENPKKLNTMHSWEIRRLNLYLGMHEDKALDAYNKMKPTRGHFEEKGMKSEDQKFFNDVWDTLQSSYSNSDKFMENDYPAVKGLQSTVSSLKGLAGQNWDGSDNINIPDVENSIVDKQNVVSKFKELNKQRIDANNEKVSNIVVDYAAEKTKFTKENGELKYDGNPFTSEVMMTVYGEQIRSKASDGTDFVDENEKNKTIDENVSAIYDRLKSSILSDTEVKDDTPQQNDDADSNNPDNPETQTESLSDLEVGKDVVKIKDSALKEAITKDPKFCDSLDGETIKFNMSAVKTYLEGIKDKPWKEFKAMKGVEKETWTIAVQIALTHLNKQESGKYKDKCDVTWIDGIRMGKTIAGVKGFQTEWNAQHSGEKPLRVDGAPGQHTINAILGELGGTQSSSTDSTDTEGDDDTSTESTGNTPKPITERIGEMSSDNILDLSDMTSLDKTGATEIADGLKDKTDVTVNLNGLTSLDGEIAGELSKINGKISIDGILQNADFEDTDFINTLTVLAPESGNLVIEADSANYDKLQDKSVKVEARAS